MMARWIDDITLDELMKSGTTDVYRILQERQKDTAFSGIALSNTWQMMVLEAMEAAAGNDNDLPVMSDEISGTPEYISKPAHNNRLPALAM